MSGSGCFVHRSVIGGLVPCLSKGFRGNCLRYSRHRLLSIVAHARPPVAMRSLASVTDLCMFLFLIQSIFRRRLTNVLSTFFACYRQTLRHGVICVLPVVVNYSSGRPSTQSLHNMYGRRGFFCRGSGSLELPVRRTARTAVNCEQFQRVT